MDAVGWEGRIRAARIVVFMSILRAQYLALWVAPLLVVAAPWLSDERGGFRRYGAACAVALGLVGLFYPGVMNENYAEYGSRAPIVSDESVGYLSAWTPLFVVERVPLTADELVAFQDDRSPWPRLRELRQIRPAEARIEMHKEAVNQMIAASGYSLFALRLRSFASLDRRTRRRHGRHQAEGHRR